jgi:hypothetical protein
VVTFPVAVYVGSKTICVPVIDGSNAVGGKACSDVCAASTAVGPACRPKRKVTTYSRRAQQKKKNSRR